MNRKQLLETLDSNRAIKNYTPHQVKEIAEAMEKYKRSVEIVKEYERKGASII